MCVCARACVWVCLSVWGVFECVGACARSSVCGFLWENGIKQFLYSALGKGGRGSDMEMSWRRGWEWIGRRGVGVLGGGRGGQSIVFHFRCTWSNKVKQRSRLPCHSTSPQPR